MNTLHKHAVVSPIALGGFLISVTAVGLGILGTHGPYPFGAIRIPLKLLGGGTAIMVYGGTLILPFILGLMGAATGAYAFQTIERSEGHWKGNGFAVFSIFIGLFAAVLTGIAIFAVLIYPFAFGTAGAAGMN